MARRSHKARSSRAASVPVPWDVPLEDPDGVWPPLPDVPLLEPTMVEKGDDEYYRRDTDRQPGEGFFEWVGRRWRLWREARSG